jgi:phage/plasmid-associated DNA primase
MKFFFSINQAVSEHVNPATGKIAPGGNFSAFNNNWLPQENTIEFLTDAVTTQQAGLCAWHLLEGRRREKSTGAIKAGLIIIDIDNQADGKDENGDKIQRQELDVAQALALDICDKYLSLAYYSPSHTETWPRFRLVFALEVPIIDAGFYQWFTRYIANQIPGSDRRATQAVNLFYGGTGTDSLIVVSDKFIPENKIKEAYAVYLMQPKQAEAGGDAEPFLQTAVGPTGVDLEQLVSGTVRSMLDGDPVDDRSFALTVALKEIIGWSNWLNSQGMATKEPPLTTAHRVFENIYEYPPDLDGKFGRILSSITEPASLQPAVIIAAEDGQLSAWKRIRNANREQYESLCPAEIRAEIAALKPKPTNSILSFEELVAKVDQKVAESQTTTSTSTSKQKPMASTPSTPAQLVSLQQGNRQFSENDVADIIVNNYGTEFLFDSSVDEFFTYDGDEGIWYIQDEQHIKRRIIKTLDTFVAAGVMPRYSAATVSSVFQLLKGKLLKSVSGGRVSIWSSSRGKIPFDNGILDGEALTFEEGNHKDLYLRNKLAFPYDKAATCPNFHAWLDSCIGSDKKIIIRAFARALLTGYTTGERFLHLVGPGGTGKSTMQQLLIALAGFSGTHTSNLETIETNKFECYNLIGKKLLLLTDEANFNKRLDVLKKITSASDTLRAERKYGKEVINFKPEVLVCIASNEHISSSDISSGLERRRLTIVMDKVVPASQRRDLLNIYQDRLEGDLVPELSGIVSWALDMPYDEMRDVLANPVKHVPSLNATNLEALIFNNPYVAWLAECTMYAPNSHALIGAGAFRPNTDEAEKGMFVKNAYGELYASYVNFCKSNGYKHSAKPRFVDRLKETIRNVLRVEGVAPKFVNGKAVFSGLRLKPYDPTTDRAAAGSNRLPSPVEWASNPDISHWKPAFEAHDQQFVEPA